MIGVSSKAYLRLRAKQMRHSLKRSWVGFTDGSEIINWPRQLTDLYKLAL